MILPKLNQKLANNQSYKKSNITWR